LSGVSDASSDDGIKSAINYANSVAQKADRLDEIKGDDGTAADMAGHYPGFVEAFNEAASGLIKLKNAQLAMSQRNLGQACADETKALTEGAQPFLNPPPDPAGLTEIPQRAEAAKSKIHDDYTKQLAQEADLTSAYNTVKSFSASDGGWSSVTSRLREA